MLKYVFLLAACVWYASSKEYTLEECKCSDGYKAEKNADEKVQCVGVMLLAIKPCNLPDAPQCKCSGQVSAIVSDDEGTWCSFSEKGENKKRWPCENKDEWATFKVAYDQFVKELRE